MKKRLSTLVLALCLGLIIASCVGPIDHTYEFKFFNNSEKDIYIVVDTAPLDEVITIKSVCWYCRANKWRYIEDRQTPWDEIVKDSIYLYIIDASMIKLSTERGFTQDDADRITPEMLLSIITLYHSETVNGHHRIFSVYYP